MADKQVDARGLSCPQPILVTKKALDGLAAGAVEVLVETATSRDNVTRMAEKLGWKVEVEELETGEFKLTLTKA